MAPLLSLRVEPATIVAGGLDSEVAAQGVMLYLKPPKLLAERLAVPNGDKPDQLHVTLVYLGKLHDLEIGVLDELTQHLPWIAANMPPIGVAFTDVQKLGSNGAYVLTGAHNESVVRWREHLAICLAPYIQWSDEFAFTPHLTLGYYPPGSEENAPKLGPYSEAVSWSATELWLKIGTTATNYPLDCSTTTNVGPLTFASEGPPPFSRQLSNTLLKRSTSAEEFYNHAHSPRDGKFISAETTSKAAERQSATGNLRQEATAKLAWPANVERAKMNGARLGGEAIKADPKMRAKVQKWLDKTDITTHDTHFTADLRDWAIDSNHSWHTNGEMLVAARISHILSDNYVPPPHLPPGMTANKLGGILGRAEATRGGTLTIPEALVVLKKAGVVIDPFHEFVATAQDNWAEGVSNSYSSLALMTVVGGRFPGHILDIHNSRVGISTHDIVKKEIKAVPYDALAYGIHAAAAADFKKQGYKPTDIIHMYRGSETPLHKGELRGRHDITIEANPLSSWSSDREVAAHFGQHLMSQNVPVSEIFATARTGFGSLEEREIVPYGKTYQTVQYIDRYGSHAANTVGIPNFFSAQEFYNHNHDRAGLFTTAGAPTSEPNHHNLKSEATKQLTWLNNSSNMDQLRTRMKAEGAAAAGEAIKANPEMRAKVQAFLDEKVATRSYEIDAPPAGSDLLHGPDSWARDSGFHFVTNGEMLIANRIHSQINGSYGEGDRLGGDPKLSVYDYQDLMTRNNSGGPDGAPTVAQARLNVKGTIYEKYFPDPFHEVVAVAQDAWASASTGRTSSLALMSVVAQQRGHPMFEGGDPKLGLGDYAGVLPRSLSGFVTHGEAMAVAAELPKAPYEAIAFGAHTASVAYFTKNGFAPDDTVHVYRGVKSNEGWRTPGAAVELQSNPLSSWSSSYSQSLNFGNHIFAQNIVIKDIFATAHTGFGAYTESEIVAYGDAYQTAQYALADRETRIPGFDFAVERTLEFYNHSHDAKGKFSSGGGAVHGHSPEPGSPSGSVVSDEHHLTVHDLAKFTLKSGSDGGAAPQTRSQLVSTVKRNGASLAAAEIMASPHAAAVTAFLNKPFHGHSGPGTGMPTDERSSFERALERKLGDTIGYNPKTIGESLQLWWGHEYYPNNAYRSTVAQLEERLFTATGRHLPTQTEALVAFTQDGWTKVVSRNVTALALMHAVKSGEVSGHVDPTYAGQREYGRAPAVYDALAYGIHAASANVLAKAGLKEGDSIQLYRGYTPDGGSVTINPTQYDGKLLRPTGQGVEPATMTMSPLSSWSLDSQTARDFGSVVVRTNFPVAEIFATSATGFGAMEEFEMVTYGKEFSGHMQLSHPSNFGNPGSVPGKFELTAEQLHEFYNHAHDAKGKFTTGGAGKNLSAGDDRFRTEDLAKKLIGPLRSGMSGTETAERVKANGAQLGAAAMMANPKHAAAVEKFLNADIVTSGEVTYEGPWAGSNLMNKTRLTLIYKQHVPEDSAKPNVEIPQIVEGKPYLGRRTYSAVGSGMVMVNTHGEALVMVLASQAIRMHAALPGGAANIANDALWKNPPMVNDRLPGWGSHTENTLTFATAISRLKAAGVELPTQEEALISRIQSGWADSVTNNPVSGALMHAARNLHPDLGSEHPIWMNPETRALHDSLTAQTEYETMKGVYDAVAYGIHTASQKVLAEQGYQPNDTIHLYRGFSTTGMPREQSNQTILKSSGDKPYEIQSNPISSWSTSRTTSRDFGAFVARADIPIKDIFATSATGFGALNEEEVIPFGMKRTGNVIRPPEGTWSGSFADEEPLELVNRNHTPTSAHPNAGAGLPPMPHIPAPVEERFVSGTNAEVAFGKAVFGHKLANGVSVEVSTVGWSLSGDLTVSGHFYKEAKPIGSFERRFGPDGVVHHDLITIKGNYHSQGIATEFNTHAEEMYRAYGFRQIKLEAGLEVGGYTWATAGYHFDKGDSAMRIAGQMRFLAKAPLPLILKIESTTDVGRTVLANPDVAEALLTPGVRAEFAKLAQRHALGEAITPLEVAMVGRDHTIESGGTTLWAGKAFLLGNTWRGVKDLNPPTPKVSVNTDAAKASDRARLASIVRKVTA